MLGAAAHAGWRRVDRYLREHAPHEDRRHDRPRLARARDARAAGRGGHGRGAAELLPRHARGARRDGRAACATPPGARGARWRSCRTSPARSCGSARCARTSSSSRPASTLTFVCGGEELAGRRPPHEHLLAGPARGRAARTRSCTSPTARCGCAWWRCAPASARSTPRSRSGGAVASRQGLNIPGPVAALPAVPEEDLRPAAPRRVDRRGHGRAVVRAVARGRRVRARAHAPAADREDGEAAGGRARRGDPAASPTA